MISKLLLLLLINIVLFMWQLHLGSVEVSYSDWKLFILGQGSRELNIILNEIRIPRVMTSLVVGIGLSLAGFMMQVRFKNPLAGPFVLGVSSGASLGVALIVALSGSITILSVIPHFVGALVGSTLVLVCVLSLARYWNDASTLLIFGLMMSYITGAIVSLLLYHASDGAIRQFTIWGMGSFQQSQMYQVYLILGISFLVWVYLMWNNQAIDQYSFGKDYAKSLGIKVEELEWILLASSGILSSIITAYCGPIAFLGLMTPHLARLIFQTPKALHLLFLVPMMGIMISQVALILSMALNADVPINTSMGILGAPFVIWLLLQRKGMK